MDRLVAIRSFVEVANAKSFTKAAESLDISRLQVSRHVQEVENWLQQRLLHRTTRKVSLTHAGEQAFVRCQRILDEAAALELDSMCGKDALVGTIRVAAPIGFAQNLLIDRVQNFVSLHPKVVIDILASDQNSELVDERVDVALRFTDKPADNLIARRLMAIDTAICASRDYLSEFGEPKHAEELVDHNCLTHLNVKNWLFVKDNQTVDVEVSGNIRANDLSTLVRVAVNGKGVIRLPCDLANPLIEKGELISILNDYHYPSYALWAVYLSRSYQQPIVRQFIDYLVECWQEDIKRK
ncbi:LysR family transcriptional regulator [Vibrio coralliilyticus]|uniref:LysR family transcriptional regulator n=1 Tax=Vibrio coralliilyticus TaxID=190893 RepID=UPI000390E273|nr:LysR family transcriptional regulator [Vibrio coralliilyticus]AIS57008.1 LysR family transcriptional regulator [Vibrio coralliilyticus]ERB67150.1 LysR family transcriptional regulator [Vibrio coralliilyticus OCN008]NOH51863.1 LysR family transcriptional regulator [Vibrio coralliilyticus]NRF64489.1 LysR family transcriptional regulator [Vibrio coralliilyticus]QIJ85921.1 LysR family transcriptional regulator [Vibrio coralliilyticus OCN008]